ncbi:predicted protein [Naegleria gruberi]|uniref:Predicted protein n=1 Tax=Naegleria gruberi TaxID=5762 RepID=D2VF85_NAEGR|nr:uncharacterized protein NAEGRDRAFT_49056 [Naegleria gruberi]EFC44416.1 predicted protein [Naegleria gruberi]|eukprot:XP_002677160.1 predicted protein [Naegleria gruberi strain NEG-M]
MVLMLMMINLSMIKAKSIDDRIKLKVKGVNFPVYDPSRVPLQVVQENLAQMASVGVNAISLEVLWEQDDFQSNEVRRNYESPSDEWLEMFIRQTKLFNMNLLIKPIIEVPGNVSMYIRPSNATLWFESYSKLIVPLAMLCERNRVESLSVALEIPYVAVPIQNLPLWNNLIASVRKVYPSGKLTYASIYYHEFEKVPFWNLLDFIGIEAYYSMATTDNPHPPLEEMKRIYISQMNYLRNWVKTIQKPIIFTEIGYPSTQACATQPTVFPTRSQGCIGPIFSPNVTCQQAAYETIFSVLPSFSDILDGLYLFSWDNPSTPDYHEGGPLYSCFFTPLMKPAFKVLTSAYSNN